MAVMKSEFIVLRSVKCQGIQRNKPFLDWRDDFFFFFFEIYHFRRKTNVLRITPFSTISISIFLTLQDIYVHAKRIGYSNDML